MYSFVPFNFLFNVDQHQSLRKKLTLSRSYCSCCVCAMAFTVGQTSYVLMYFNIMKPLGSYFFTAENIILSDLILTTEMLRFTDSEMKQRLLHRLKQKHDKNEKESQGTKQFALICFKLLCDDNYIIAL